ncbi:MAG TPA: ABC transporter permease [Anaerolineae bacterium]|jgi:ABC-2 type transport system permease protein|nr:ABC transporter permease [Anaerolineae bacterium]
MWRRIFNLVVKDLQQFLRDRVLLIFVLVGPTFQLMMMGQATASDIEHLPTAIVDGDRTSDSRALTVALDNLDALDVTHYLEGEPEAGPLLDRGEISIAVVIPAGFASSLDSPSERAKVQLLVDGSQILGAYAALSAAEGAIAKMGSDVALERLQSSGTSGPRVPTLDLRTTARFNEEMNHSYYLLPSQLSLIVLIVTLLVSSVGIVRERETGTLEQLMVTPLRRVELIVAKATLPTIVAFVDFVAMLAMTVLVFGLPIRGSIALLLAVTLVFIMVQQTWGLVISAVSATQQQAVLLVFMMGILSVAFSGYLVAVQNMPVVMQLVSNLFPISHYLSMLRAIMLKGATITHIGPQLSALALLGVANLVISVRSFRKQLE